jgi:hypothetical protein
MHYGIGNGSSDGDPEIEFEEVEPPSYPNRQNNLAGPSFNIKPKAEML